MNTSPRRNSMLSLCKLRMLFCLFLTAVLSACAGPAAVPTDHFYRLPAAAASPLEKSLLNGTLSIAPLSAGGLYNERALLYVDGDQPLELKRYRYYLWNNVPGNLLQEHLYSFLRDVGAADQIVLFEPGLETDYTLSGRISRFEREFGNGRDQVKVSLHFLLMRGGKLVWEKEYTVATAVQGAAVHDAVDAFGAALQQVYEAFLQDVGKSVSR